MSYNCIKYGLRDCQNSYRDLNQTVVSSFLIHIVTKVFRLTLDMLDYYARRLQQLMEKTCL